MPKEHKAVPHISRNKPNKQLKTKDLILCVVLTYIAFSVISNPVFLSQLQMDYPNKNHFAKSDVVQFVYQFEKLITLVELEHQIVLNHLNPLKL